MAEPKWSRTWREKTLLPINLHMAKAYVLGDVEYNANHWTRVFDLGDGPIVAKVRQKQPLTTDITLRMEADYELSEKEIDEIRDRIRYEIGADEKLDALRDVKENDIMVRIALKNSAGLRLFANSNTVETAICTMMQQNLDYSIYLEILNQFVSKYGEPVRWEPGLHLFPKPEIIAEMGIEDWDELGLGIKSEFLGIMGKQTLKNFQIYAYYPIFERGIDGLTRIEGVGEYTARIIMVYAARRYEKAFIDGYVQEILDHKYKLHQVLPLSEFDKWIQQRWPQDPALVLHAHIQDYLPAYIRDYDFSAIGRATD